MAHSSRPRRPWEEGEPLSSASPEEFRPIAHRPVPYISSPESSQNSELSYHPRRSSGSQNVLPAQHQRIPSISSQTTNTSKRRRMVDIDPEQHQVVHAPGECCDSSCNGPQCHSMRALIHNLYKEISAHELLVHGATLGSPRSGEAHTQTFPLTDSLDAACDRLKQSNASLRGLLDLKNAAGQPPSSTNHTYNEYQNSQSETTAVRRLSTAQDPSAPVASTTSSSAIGASHDLQAQLTTLTREHTALIRKLETSQASIAALKYEKERLEVQGDSLEKQVEALEKQLEDVQLSRDDALKASSKSAEQYLRIMEMAGRLHGGTGGELVGSSSSAGSSATPKPHKQAEAPASLTSTSSSPTKSRAVWLEEEVVRLRERNATLEYGIRAARQVASSLTKKGQDVESALDKALMKGS